MPSRARPWRNFRSQRPDGVRGCRRSSRPLYRPGPGRHRTRRRRIRPRARLPGGKRSCPSARPPRPDAGEADREPGEIRRLHQFKRRPLRPPLLFQRFSSNIVVHIQYSPLLSETCVPVSFSFAGRAPYGNSAAIWRPQAPRTAPPAIIRRKKAATALSAYGTGRVIAGTMR
jgi:hypothetical protein